MLRLTMSTFLVLASTTVFAAQQASNTASGKYQQLVSQFEQNSSARSFAPRFLALAKAHPDKPAAVDALLWIVKNVRGRSATDSALAILLDKHVRNAKLGRACSDIAGSRSARAEPLLRGLLDRHPDKSVRAQAGYYLAELLEAETNLVAQLKAQPDLATRVLQYYRKEYGKHLSSINSAQLEEQREKIYKQLIDEFPDFEVGEDNVQDFAESRLFRLQHLSVGKVAPEIEGQDVDGNDLKLSDFRGKVVMLTFWGHW